MSRISLAFYHLPHHLESAACLLISDVTHIYGLKKCPLGVGLSPFNLTLLTNAIADHIYHKYNIFCFTYLDDFSFSHPNPKCLAAISHSCIQGLQTYGIPINYDKSMPEPVQDVHYIGY